MTLDLTKAYTTRDGREAKVLGTMPDGRLCGWVAAEIPGVYVSAHWAPNGQYGLEDSGMNLVNVPEKRTVTVWINIGDGDVSSYAIYGSREEADAMSTYSDVRRIACIEREITFDVDEGLEGLNE